MVTTPVPALSGSTIKFVVVLIGRLNSLKAPTAELAGMVKTGVVASVMGQALADRTVVTSHPPIKQGTWVMVVTSVERSTDA